MTIRASIRPLLATVPGFLGLGLLSLTFAGTATAQRQGYSYVAWTGSDVSLTSKASEDAVARVNTPVMAGDRLQTGSSSRAEVILADGCVLRVDGRTAVRFDRLAKTYETDDERDHLFVEKGAVALETRSSSPRDTAPRLDTDDATVVVPERAVVRIDAGKRGTEIHVLNGRAEVAGRSGRAVVRAGESAYVSGDEPIEVEATSFPKDRFSRFIGERRDRAAQSSGSRNVPEEYAYDYDQADLDEYGSWSYVAASDSYGWSPRVEAGWVPYSNGYWRWTPAGLTWVSYDSWGWLPFHYGSWCHDDSLGWYWLPGGDYSPAWVYWNYWDQWIGWCPTGYYGNYGGWGHHGGGGHPPGKRYDRAVDFPHLAGPVDISRIDRRGWNFVSADRFGSRFEPADVVRGEKLSVRPGQLGVVSSTPLRVERGQQPSISLAVQESVRRLTGAGLADGKGIRPGGPAADGLTEILRREPNLSPAGRDALKRSWARSADDVRIRPVAGEAAVQGGKPAPSPGAAASGPPLVRLEGGTRSSPSWRDAAPAPRRESRDGGRAVDPGRNRVPRGDDGWRSSSAPRTAPRSLDSPSSIERRSVDAPRAADPRRSFDGGRGTTSASPRGVETERSRPVPPPSAAPHWAPAAPSHAPAPSNSSSPGPAPRKG